MRRRVFLSTVAGGLLATSLMVEAQPARKVWRIGFLTTPSPTAAAYYLEAFREGLRELGYVKGKTIVIEYRFAEGRPERLPNLAAELVCLKVDVIVTGGPPAPEEAKQATRTIPIVFAVAGDPVGEGLVASLARPGGNITGLASIAAEVVGKQLELLKEVVPKVSRVAVLQNPSHSAHPLMSRQAEGSRSSPVRPWVSSWPGWASCPRRQEELSERRRRSVELGGGQRGRSGKRSRRGRSRRCGLLAAGWDNPRVLVHRLVVPL